VPYQIFGGDYAEAYGLQGYRELLTPVQREEDL